MDAAAGNARALRGVRRRASRRARAITTHAGYLVFRREDDALVGVFNFSEIVRGAFRSAYLGYFAFAPHAGSGYMTEGMALALDIAFGRLKLHRVEVNIQPTNTRSLALAQRIGFTREGFSRRYVKIARPLARPRPLRDARRGLAQAAAQHLRRKRPPAVTRQSRSAMADGGAGARRRRAAPPTRSFADAPKAVTGFPIAPYEIHEECAQLDAGDRLDYRFEAQEPVAFHIYYKDGITFVAPVSREDVHGILGHLQADARRAATACSGKPDSEGALVDYRIRLLRGGAPR